MAGKVTPVDDEDPPPQWTSFEGIDWSKRPDAETDTHIQVVLQFKHWEIFVRKRINTLYTSALTLFSEMRPTDRLKKPTRHLR